MKVGLIGNAGRMAQALQDVGVELVARPAGAEAAAGFAVLGVACIEDYAGFFEALDHPRLYFLDASVGPSVDAIIDEAYQSMEPGDLIVDATESYWCDTRRRYRRMRHRALYYIDTAWLRRDGLRALLVGGDEAAITIARPCLEHLAGGRMHHLGGPSIAHYAAMVDDAAKEAMRHVANEAALMLEAWPAEADDELLKQLWPLLQRRDIGRAAWQVDDAVQLEAATPLLAQSIMLTLAEALDDQESAGPPQRVGTFQYPDEIG